MADTEVEKTGTDAPAVDPKGGEAEKPKSEVAKPNAKTEGGEAKKEEKLPADTFTPAERQRPWKNREERDQFFISQKKDKEAKTGDEEGKDENPDAELEAKMEKLFEKRFGGVFSQLEEKELSTDVSSFLNKPENAHFSKYENIAIKAAKVYQNVPVDFIFKALDYDNAMLRGVERSKQIETTNRSRSAGGNSKREVRATTPDFSKMTSEQIEAFNNDLRRVGSIKPEGDE